MSEIKELSDDNFHSFIKKGEVVVDFWAEWCGPCKIMAPHFHKAAEEFKDIKFAKVDVDGNQDLAGKYDIMSIPTTIFFKDGEMIDKEIGAMSFNEIKKKIGENF